MDEVQVELRRRLWHTILLVDFMSAEARGLEPMISEDSFTTLLPRNVDENDLVEGRPPSMETTSQAAVTSYSFQLIRLTGFCYLRKVFHKTQKVLQNLRARDEFGDYCANPVAELQNLFREVQNAVNEMRALNDRNIIQCCRDDIPSEKFVVDLAARMECRVWTFYWSKMPKVYRDLVFTPELRAT